MNRLIVLVVDRSQWCTRSIQTSKFFQLGNIRLIERPRIQVQPLKKFMNSSIHPIYPENGHCHSEYKNRKILILFNGLFFHQSVRFSITLWNEYKKWQKKLIFFCFLFQLHYFHHMENVQINKGKKYEEIFFEFVTFYYF